MASFTDSIQALTSFSPYVDQFPVEAALNVGRIKQTQYNQGVEKIQSQIDNIAGLDVIRDVDKQYLQSRLNQLGGNLKKVAAGDFSNYQLVNSVGGMISQIGKDSNIQNAVASTQRVKKGQADMESARKSGKSSPENEWWWNNQVNGWLNDKNIESSFNGAYVEYRDVDSKLRTIAEKLHEIDNSIDIPFQRDAAGNILNDRNGKPLVDDAMLRIKTKGKPAEKILANFYDSLDENDKRQLAITANYHYRGVNKDALKYEIQSNYRENKKLLSDSLINLNLELQTNSKLSVAQKGEYHAKIADVSNKLNSGSLESELYSELSDIDNTDDLDGYKYKLYTQKYLTNLAKDVSWQSYQQEIVSNPYTQMGMEKARLQFQYDNANRQQRNWEADFNWKQAEFFAKQQKEQGSSKPATPGRLATDITVPTLSQLDKEITDLTGDRRTGKLGQIDVLNSQYAPLITDGSIPDVNQKRTYLDGLAEQYSRDPSTITSIKDPNVREYLERRRALDIQIAQKQNLYSATVEVSKGFDNQLGGELNTQEGLKDVNGYPLFTAKELYDIGRSGLKFTQEDSDEAMRLIGKKGTGGWSTETVLQKAVDVYRNNYKKLEKINTEKAKFQSEYLAQRMPEKQSSIFTLDVNNSKAEDRIDERAVEQLLGAKFLEFEQAGSTDSEKFKEFDPSTVSEFKKDKEASYIIEKTYDGGANLIISSKGEQQIVPMTDSEFSTFFPGYSRTNPIENIKYAILGSANKTTNLSGRKDDAVNAYITGYSLPQIAKTVIAPLVRVDVEGSPFNKGDESDRYVVRMYVNDNGVWKSDVITQEGYINDATLQTVLQNIGTKTVDDLLKKNRK